MGAITLSLENALELVGRDSVHVIDGTVPGTKAGRSLYRIVHKSMGALRRIAKRKSLPKSHCYRS